MIISSKHSLRFIANGDQKNFIITSNSAWEIPEGTQIPIYLYCSEAGREVHDHVWGNWSMVNDDVHKRVCTVDGCIAFDLASHSEDESKGCTPDSSNTVQQGGGCGGFSAAATFFAILCGTGVALVFKKKY